MAASSLIGPLVALVKPAVSAVAGDVYRRYRIQKKFAAKDPSEQSPIMRKALSDLDVLIGNEGLLTQSVSGVIDELKSSGILELIARDAFYENDDPGVRAYFEALFARHSPKLDRAQQEAASKTLYATIRFMLRESIRLQVNPELLFVFDTEMKNSRTRHDTAPSQQIKMVTSDLRPEALKRIALAGQTLVDSRLDESGPLSALERRQFPEWVYLAPALVENKIKHISGCLIGAYEYVRIDGPAERTYNCEIDKLYVPARLAEADFSIKTHDIKTTGVADVSISELLSNSNQCAVIGDPGGGKSTLSQRICLDTLRRAHLDGKSPMAVRVEVRRFVRRDNASSNQSLIEFITWEISRQAEVENDEDMAMFVRYLLHFGRIIIIFDGIDEIISSARRRQLIDATQQLANRFLQVHFIFTCRRTDFLVTPIRGVRLFELQQFIPAEIDSYFRSASKHVFQMDDAEIDQKSPDFSRQAHQYAPEFVVNPLLLALIVWIYNVAQRIPDNRIELYRECSELLFRRWDSLKEIDPELPDSHWLFQLVTEIAHRLYLIDRKTEGDSGAEWLKQTALNFFRGVYDGDVENRSRAAADRFVGHLIGRSWVLQERIGGVFEFTHRTFMEYYFARWLDDQYDGVKPLFEFVARRIRAGEWTVPIHLAFQLKCAGKLRSAESLTAELLRLLEETKASDAAWENADGAERRRLKAEGLAPTVFPETPNVLQFIVASIGYVQPSEAAVVRLTKALTNAVASKKDAKDEWFSVVGGLVSSPTPFHDSIAEGIYQSLADDIAAGRGYTVGFVVDWLYSCYLSKRPEHAVPFGGHVLRFADVRTRFGGRFLAQIKEGRGSASLPKITFDLTGVAVPAVAEVGLAMWSASIVPDKRTDWRFIDFGLGLMESIDAIIDERSEREHSYVEFFAKIAEVVPAQKNFQISGGVGVLAPFSFALLGSVADRLGHCSTKNALAFAVSLIGFIELSARLHLCPVDGQDSEATAQALRLGVPVSPAKVDADRMLRILADRQDIDGRMREFILGWIEEQHAMFRPSVRTEYVSHRQAFSGLNRL
ncbi:GTPase SAR1 family protein [Bradyrhizobium japonicum USDA 38]|uniref:NACHT domain-containing protein n=1 Tax=Bradyrhizobium japonicum TaxID=375 RepID=UPI000407624E|nr:NACHT domain-containing protein [Bradyrhizobium japonicum]MCS3893288.1 GTPase SAR1 family protein [Bradyrhizobium japonicum USDA 38]MCS3945802.1 GTPase SAR1 family protein [Bradyrhizobium japonicum]